MAERPGIEREGKRASQSFGVGKKLPRDATSSRLSTRDGELPGVLSLSLLFAIFHLMPRDTRQSKHTCLGINLIRGETMVHVARHQMAG